MKKRFTLILLVFILVSGIVYAQNECQVKITYSMNKSLPPSYTFNTDFKSENAKFYWYFNDGARYEKPSPTHTFKTTGNYVIEVKVIDSKGNVCFGRTAGQFEGTDNPTKDTTLINAKGWVKDMSSIAGCGLVISTDDGKVLLPVEISPNFALKEGQRIAFAFEYLENIATNCMAGRTIKINRIEEISDNKPVLIEARGKVIDYSKVKGCGLVIAIENSKILVPVEIIPDFELKEGQQVKFVYEQLAILGGVCVEGPLVRIHRIAEIPVTTSNIYARGKVVDLTSTDGCGLAIQLADGTTLVPVEILPEIALKEGLFIEFTYEVLNDVATVCKAGKNIRIHRLKIMDSNTPVILSGKGVVKDLSSLAGCGLAIVLENGRTLIPVEFATDFDLKEGQFIELAFEVLNDRASVCMAGTLVKVHKIAEIGTQDKCTVETTYKLINQSKMTYQFFARTNVNVKTWEWDFGDGNTSAESEPEHSFEKSGVYTVVCTIYSDNGCKASARITVMIQSPGLPVCPGGLNLLLFDPTEGKCDGKAIATLLDDSQTEYKDVVYRWSTGQTGNTANNLCTDKPYYLHALIEGVCQKNTSFTFLSKPMWRVSATDGKYTFQVTNPVDGVTYTWDMGNGEIAYGTTVTYDFNKDGDYTIRLIANFGADSKESEQVIRVQNTVTNVDITEKPLFRVYPNPATDRVWIEPGQSFSGTVKAEISDLQGKIIYQRMLDFSGSTQTEINIQHLPSGFYFIRLSDGNAIKTEKLVVR
jgi:PKD repeat protein